MKRIFSMILMLAIICGVISWQAAAAGDGSGPEIRNVIIMIPDGG